MKTVPLNEAVGEHLSAKRQGRAAAFVRETKETVKTTGRNEWTVALENLEKPENRAMLPPVLSFCIGSKHDACNPSFARSAQIAVINSARACVNDPTFDRANVNVAFGIKGGHIAASVWKPDITPSTTDPEKVYDELSAANYANPDKARYASDYLEDPLWIASVFRDDFAPGLPISCVTYVAPDAKTILGDEATIFPDERPIYFNPPKGTEA